MQIYVCFNNYHLRPADQPRKTFADWTVEEVCELVKGTGFTDAATVLAQNHVDGKTVCSAEISNGGLGLTPMQKAQLKEEIKRVTFCLCDVWPALAEGGERSFLLLEFYTK